LTNPTPSTTPPSIATCLRCGRQYSPALEGDRLLCGQCVAAQPRVSVTMVLIAINVLVFVGMLANGVSATEPTTADLLAWGASYGPLELSTDWWRLFTAMFVHIGVLHIALNMYCLWSLGPLAERLFGPWRFLSLYVLSGVGGNVASVGLHPAIVAAGASGAIFGIAGALLPVLHLRNIPAIAGLRGRGGRLGIGGFIAYNLIYGFANAGIDNAAHIGGLGIGFLIGYAAPVAGSHSGRAAAWRTQGVLLAIAILLAVVFAGVRGWRR
jgi:rhomboid protease GluP